MTHINLLHLRNQGPRKSLKRNSFTSEGNLMGQRVGDTTTIWKVATRNCFAEGQNLYKNTLWVIGRTIYHGITSTSQANSSWVLPPVEAVGKSNSDQNQLREEQKHISHHEKSSAMFFTLLSMRYMLQFWWHWCHSSSDATVSLTGQHV